MYISYLSPRPPPAPDLSGFPLPCLSSVPFLSHLESFGFTEHGTQPSHLINFPSPDFFCSLLISSFQGYSLPLFCATFSLSS